MNKLIIVLIMLLLGLSNTGYSQAISKEKKESNKSKLDSTDMPLKRNVLKWNLTPMMWSYKNFNLSYERTTSNHGSFSVNAGYFIVPILNGSLADSFNIKNTNKNYGFSISGDKRYYFKKRNVSPAPDGLYWGIFGSVHYTGFENTFEVVNSELAKGDLILKGNLAIFSAGVELGYQFVFKNNLTVDLIFMGPALSSYSGKLGISGDLQVDKESEYLQGIYDAIVARYPGVDKLLDEKSIKGNGTVLGFGPGLRYMVQIGYRF